MVNPTNTMQRAMQAPPVGAYSYKVQGTVPGGGGGLAPSSPMPNQSNPPSISLVSNNFLASAQNQAAYAARRALPNG